MDRTTFQHKGRGKAVDAVVIEQAFGETCVVLDVRIIRPPLVEFPVNTCDVALVIDDKGGAAVPAPRVVHGNFQDFNLLPALGTRRFGVFRTGDHHHRLKLADGLGDFRVGDFGGSHALTPSFEAAGPAHETTGMGMPLCGHVVAQ